MLPAIQIKGVRDGLFVTIREGEWENLRNALLEQIGQQGDFYRGGRLAIHVENRVLGVAELGDLRSEISEKGVTLWAVISTAPKTIRAAQSLGLATRISSQVLDKENGKSEVHPGDSVAVFIKRTLRSGYKVQHPGNVVVLGDVNPGAEIVAGGDIIVWGHLRGVVHAGADGNTQAVICALDLSPAQLRIADKIALTPKRKGKPHPEVARIKGDRLIAESWTNKE